MAGALGSNLRELQAHLQDITDCCICAETYQDPRILPCIHTFCRKCLEDTASKSDRKPGKTMPCPLCRREFTIPPDGVSGLEKNFFMVQLMEMATVAEAPASSVLCDACLVESDSASATEIPSAEMFCTQCSLKLCASCCKHHKKLKITMAHELVTLHAQSITERRLEAQIREVCEKHEMEKLKIHCFDCKAVVCAFCFIEVHQNHKWADVNIAAERLRQQIQGSVRFLSSQTPGLQAKRVELNQAKDDINENTTALKESVSKLNVFMKQMIDEHSDSLLRKLESRRQEKLAAVALEHEDIDLQISNAESFAMYCQKVTSEGSAVAICRASAELRRRGKELGKMSIWISKRQVPTSKLLLKSAELEEYLTENGLNLIGTIEENDKNQKSDEMAQGAKPKQVPDGGNKKPTEVNQPIQKAKKKDKNTDKNKDKKKDKNKDKNKDQEKQQTPKKTDATDGKEPSTPLAKSEPKKQESTVAVRVIHTKSRRITGIAIIDQELFVATESNSTIEVLDLLQFNMKRAWLMPGFMNPGDMVSSENRNCLFIFDAKGVGKIYQVSPVGVVIHQWTIGSLAVRLSVTSDSNVLVVYTEKKMLKEYQATGKKRMIKALAMASGCRFAAKYVTGSFLVSREEGNDGNCPHGVFEVDATGKDTKASFTGKSGSLAAKMNCPEQLIVDRYGWVIVADRGNRRVLLLDSSLEFQRVLISSSKDGLHDPRALALDGSTRQLLVADYDPENSTARIFLVPNV